MLAHEMMNFVKKRKKGKEFTGILKIDLNKAYDRITWDFLEKVLRAYNFPETWIRWIMQCISSVSYSILVNGEPSESFKPKCGLRQGDPLSPYLFILCMEVLSKKMISLQDSGDVTELKPVLRRRCTLFL